MKRRAIAAAAAVFFFQYLTAQPMERPQADRPGFLLYEGISRAGEDSTHSRVDVPYRIDYEFFVPVKNSDTSIPWPFIRRGEVAIDLMDSLGESRARRIEDVLIGQNSSERNPEQKQWYQGISSFVVPPGSYTIQVEVTDAESQHNYIEKDRRLRVHSFAPSRFAMSTPVFVQDGVSSRFPDTLIVQNFGGDPLFATPGALFFEVGSDVASDTSLHVSWNLREGRGSREEVREVARDSAARTILTTHLQLDSLKAENSVRYLVGSNAASFLLGVLVPLPIEKLPLRLYNLDLDVTAGSHKEHRTLAFRTVWPTMPFSLRDVDMALDALRFIVTPDQLDSLKDGNFEERREHLETFWQRRNKTPGTAENKLMTEYYHRVDYAIRNFGTLRVPDGSRTDRGKIYILYGPPTSMDRSLDPVAGYRETWVYARLGKKFVFKDQTKSGNYVLTTDTGS